MVFYMDFLPLGFVFILIGIPALIGSYNVGAQIGRESIRNGLGVLIYAAALAAAFAILLPKGNLVPGNYVFKSPGMFIGCAVLGAVAGFVSRFSNK